MASPTPRGHRDDLLRYQAYLVSLSRILGASVGELLRHFPKAGPFDGEVIAAYRRADGGRV